MWPNPQETMDLVTFTEKILNGKLHFLCSVSTMGTFLDYFCKLAGIYHNNGILFYGIYLLFGIISIVDLWDGPTEPIIYHGLTLTSRIRLIDVVKVIKEYAFKQTE